MISHNSFGLVALVCVFMANGVMSLNDELRQDCAFCALVQEINAEVFGKNDSDTSCEKGCHFYRLAAEMDGVTGNDTAKICYKSCNESYTIELQKRCCLAGCDASPEDYVQYLLSISNSDGHRDDFKGRIDAAMTAKWMEEFEKYGFENFTIKAPMTTTEPLFEFSPIQIASTGTHWYIRFVQYLTKAAPVPRWVCILVMLVGAGFVVFLVSYLIKIRPPGCCPFNTSNEDLQIVQSELIPNNKRDNT